MQLKKETEPKNITNSMTKSFNGHKKHWATKKLVILIAWLIEFYGISTVVGYLMPNPVYIYIYI